MICDLARNNGNKQHHKDITQFQAKYSASIMSTLRWYPSRPLQGLQPSSPRALELESSPRRLGSSTDWDELAWSVVESWVRNTPPK